MASDWRYTVVLIDEHSIKTSMVFKANIDGLSLTDEFALAQTMAADLLTDLQAVTDAAVYSESLTYVIGNSEALPADADVTDELVVLVWLSDVGEVNKQAAVRIPAPIDAAFESDGVTLDKTNAAVQAFVANFGTDLWEVSDGETVVTGRDNGIVSGHWRSRAKSTAKK
jgi:hypothetical protein